jgi:hypothetical protein
MTRYPSIRNERKYRIEAVAYRVDKTGSMPVFGESIESSDDPRRLEA